jgi:hypothetical protein
LSAGIACFNVALIQPFQHRPISMEFAFMSITLSRWLPGLFLTVALPLMAHAEGPRYGPELQGFEYPYTLKHFAFQSQGKSCRWVTWMSPPTARPTAAPWC